MKEIKLRVFDKLSKLMFKNDEIIWNSGKVIKLYDQEWFSVNQKDIELMQYTGILDKNGVEIYEGDILKCWLKYQSYKPTFIEDVKVIDLNNTLPFSREFNIENKTYKDRVGACEVIGNIYENSELLQ